MFYKAKNQLWLSGLLLVASAAIFTAAIVAYPQNKTVKGQNEISDYNYTWNVPTYGWLNKGGVSIGPSHWVVEGEGGGKHVKECWKLDKYKGQGKTDTQVFKDGDPTIINGEAGNPFTKGTASLNNAPYVVVGLYGLLRDSKDDLRNSGTFFPVRWKVTGKIGSGALQCDLNSL